MKRGKKEFLKLRPHISLIKLRILNSPKPWHLQPILVTQPAPSLTPYPILKPLNILPIHPRFLIMFRNRKRLHINT